MFCIHVQQGHPDILGDHVHGQDNHYEVGDDDIEFHSADHHPVKYRGQQW